jgi:hypothetical protein
MLRVSVFTPAHRPDHLAQLYESLTAQTYPCWEWVILPNNGLVDMAVIDDSRVKILPYIENPNIGALKRICCDAATGDLFVELDFDDWLAPDGLEKLAAAVKGVSKAFVYSDRSPVDDRGRGTVMHTPKDGWVSYQKGGYWATRCFPLTPLSLCKIQYAPDHVRAWTRAAYESAGGHDPQLACCDDLDLMTRTYLDGAAFIHVPEPLYFYRYHGENSYRARQEEIRGRNRSICANTLLPVARAWSARHNLKVIEGPPAALVASAGNDVGLFVATTPIYEPAPFLKACREGAIVRLPQRLDPRPEPFRFVQRVDSWYDYAVWKGGPFPGVNPEELHAGDHRAGRSEHDGRLPVAGPSQGLHG